MNIGRNIIKSPKALQEAVDKLNGAIQHYTATIGDLELRLSVEIFKQGQDLQNSLLTCFDQLNSRFDSIEPEIQILASMNSFILHHIVSAMLIDRRSKCDSRKGSARNR